LNFYTINRGLNKRLHNYFSYRSRKIVYGNKIKREINELRCRKLTNSQKKEIKKYFASFGFKSINMSWHRYYTHLSGEFYKEYIPEDLYYNVFEPSLNMLKMYPALTDKNLLGKLFKGVKQPESVLRNINGVFYTGDGSDIIRMKDGIEECKKYSKLIIKPSLESGGGKNIVVFNVNGNHTDHNNMLLEDLIKSYKTDFIVQKYLVQHEQMSLLNPNSVNTLRMKSLLINDKVEILGSIVRIGGLNSFVDNTSQGGIYCGIEPEGILSEKGYHGDGKFKIKTETKIKLKDFMIPNYNKIREDIIELHKQIPYFKFISWDIAIDQNGESVLIEINVFGQGVHAQHTYGPLFGKFTDEVLSNCKLYKFSNQTF